MSPSSKSTQALKFSYSRIDCGVGQFGLAGYLLKVSGTELLHSLKDLDVFLVEKSHHAMQPSIEIAGVEDAQGFGQKKGK